MLLKKTSFACTSLCCLEMIKTSPTHTLFKELTHVVMLGGDAMVAVNQAYYPFEISNWSIDFVDSTSTIRIRVEQEEIILA